ncbi:FliH/SctL family protein [Lachnospiraceae bacterium 50-23]|jgi:flagellar assembly protein FliH|nr:hypothetical protein IMSAGC015_00133 [Lachnospiraceae bacterium]
MRSLPRIMKGLEDERIVKPYDFFAGFQIKKPEEEQPEGDPEDQLMEETGPRSAYSEEIIQAAREQAAQILSDAREQAEFLRTQAYEEGRKEGYETGSKEGYEQAYNEHHDALNEELGNLRKNISNVVQSVSIEKEKVLEKYTDDLKRISLAVAEKIIQTSLHSSGDIVKRMILAATDKMTKKQWAKIYVTKTNTGISMNADTEFLEALSRLSDNIKIVTMDNEEEGTCIIELPDEIIDASVSTQLENIKDIINNARV